MVAALLANPQPHIGKVYHLTGPQSENMHFYAQEYSKALGRTITFQDIPVEPWRDGLLERGLPVHLVNHLATMADLHRAGRYDRMSDDVHTLTGQAPLSVQEFVRKNAATFTASAKKDSTKGKHRKTRGWMMSRVTGSPSRYGDVSILLKVVATNHSIS